MTELNRYNRLVQAILNPGTSGTFDFTDKEQNAFLHIRYMLSRTQRIFEYHNLPETIPQRNLELLLQCNGFACITKVNNNLYAFFGGLGGEPDVYYMPTICTISNPALNISKNLRINEDCVIIKNDGMYNGLLPLYSRYAALLAENELSMKFDSINSRIIALISAQDDRTKLSAEKFLADIEAGKRGVIAENAFLDGIKTTPFNTYAGSRHIIDLIEFEQYLKASWWNDIGINANFNMKREQLNSNETEVTQNTLLPLIDEMLECRKQGIEKVNEMYNTNITIEKSSAWQVVANESEIQDETMEQEEISNDAKTNE